MFWSICISSLLHFKNDRKYLRVQSRYLSLWWYFCYMVLSQVALWFSWDSLFCFFFHLHFFDDVSFQCSQIFVGFLFSESSDFFLIYSSIPFVMCCFTLFIISMTHFSMPNSIPTCWLYILTGCVRVCNSLSFFENSLISSMNVMWLIFSCTLVSFYPTVHYLIMFLSDIIAFINSNGCIAYPWNISLWIFSLANFFSPPVNSTFQVFMVYSINFMTSSDILFIWGSLLSNFAIPYHMYFCSQAVSRDDYY